MKWLLSICFVLFLIACDGGGSSETLQYPEESSETQSSSVEPSAGSSSETVSSVIVSSSSEESSSSETLSNSSSSVASESSAGLSSSAIVESSSSMVLYVSFGTMTDERDGQNYKTVTIEWEYINNWSNYPFEFVERIPRITWMIENLNYAYLQPTAELDSSSWCFNNEPDNCAGYGRLYLWSAAMDSAGLFGEDGKGCGYFATKEEWVSCTIEEDKGVRGVCPDGWRLPKYQEEYGWIVAQIRDIFAYEGYIYGFESTKPIGFFSFESNKFIYDDANDAFWLSTESNEKNAYHDNFWPLSLAYSEGASLYDAIVALDKRNAFPVRCVKD